MEGRYAPNEVLVLPGGADTSDLEDKNTVVEKVIHMTHECTVTPDSDMLHGMLVRHW
jgi:hypothetical protein